MSKQINRRWMFAAGVSLAITLSACGMGPMEDQNGRPLKLRGEVCESSSQCQTGVCVRDINFIDRYCSELCETNTCAEGFRCVVSPSSPNTCYKQKDAPRGASTTPPVVPPATPPASNNPPASAPPAQQTEPKNPLGGRCFHGNHCQSGFCVFVIKGDSGYCSQYCSLGCPSGFACTPLAQSGNACVPGQVAPKPTGKQCDPDNKGTDCQGSICLTQGDHKPFCTMRCKADLECPGKLLCTQTAEGYKVCALPR